MGRLVEVRMPKYPECWDSCGNCRTEDVFVQSVLVRAGDSISFDDTLIVLETGKVALDIPCPQMGRIIEVKVEEGDLIDEGDVIVLVEAA
jgi:Pyruvate/2-oxoglutarate dehydrogenase complex, dihydrolipoamide acyltransferase (E2) component, and related enzymes